MGERLLCKQEVIGSIPFTSTTVLASAKTAATAAGRGEGERQAQRELRRERDGDETFSGRSDEAQLAAARGRRGMVFDMVKREQSDRDGSNRSWRSGVAGFSREGGCGGVGGLASVSCGKSCLHESVGPGLAPGRDGGSGFLRIPHGKVSMRRASGGCLGAERR